MNETESSQSLHSHAELRAILANPRAYPLQLTLADGRKLQVPQAKFIHFPPRLKNIMYFPPRKSDGLMECISPDRVTDVRRLKKKRAA